MLLFNNVDFIKYPYLVGGINSYMDDNLYNLLSNSFPYSHLFGCARKDLSNKYSQSLTQYDWQTQNLNTQLARNQADYATYTSQNQQDFNYNIASQNKDYSKALSSASSAYWQRGILKSGIAKQQAQEATQEFSNEQAYFKTLNQRKLDEANLTLWRTTEDINNIGSMYFM